MGNASWCIWLLLLLALLGGCASVPAPHRPPMQQALPPQPGSVFEAADERLAAQDRELSGFRLLDRNEDALLWRLALIENATHSLDLQYYVWFSDKVGQLLMTRVLAAADRGVKVRLLFDDLNTLLQDMTHLEERDASLRKINRHPNIQIRTFNAWEHRWWLARVLETASRFERLNRRMHNKQMVVDNRVAIVGGRNIGDEYFGLHEDFNFHDLDLLGLGPVARQASQVFDRFWNSEWVQNIPDGDDQRAQTSPRAQQAWSELRSHSELAKLLAGQRDWETHLRALAQDLLPGSSAVHTDSPASGAGRHNHMPDAFRALMLSAQQEVLITNAYIIPDPRFIEDLAELVGRGVRVRILTNSLASQDVPAVNSHYEPWRLAMLKAGVDLHELKPRPAIQAKQVDSLDVHSAFVGLHTKAMVIDRERSFIGSMNLDPRSEVLNSEMGVIVRSPGVSRQLAERMQQDMGVHNSWKVQIGADGALEWHDGQQPPLRRQPARNAWQRVENLFFKLFPPHLY